MGVALVPGQNRQQQRTQHVALARRVRARVGKGTFLDPVLVEPACLEKLYKEGQLPQRRSGRFLFPPQLHPPAKSLHSKRCWLHRELALGLTHLVTPFPPDERVILPCSASNRKAFN